MSGRVRRYTGKHWDPIVPFPSGRTELERQALIAELRRLRAAGLNVDRQDRVLWELRNEFELGWPEPCRSLGELGGDS